MQKRLLTVLTSGLLAAGASATASAQALEAKVSGQVDRALMWVDDGTQTELQNVDNSFSSTRLRLAGSGQLTPSLKAGAVFENEFQSNPSNKVTQTVKSVAPVFAERHAFAYFQGGFGRLSVGQTDGAANYGTEVDLSGTDLAQGALATNAIGGGILFRNTTTTGPSIGATTSNQDFESRYDLLRYDTPAFGPLTLALSSGVSSSRDVREAALRYNGDVAGGQLAAAVGWSNKDADPADPSTFDQDTTGGSVSWLFAGGLNITFATSKRDVATSRKGKFDYVKLGYKIGGHAFSVDFGKAKDQAAADDEAKVMGIGWVYKPVKWADVYAAAEQHSLDRPGTNFDDIRIVMAGSRIKF